MVALQRAIGPSTAWRSWGQSQSRAAGKNLGWKDKGRGGCRKTREEEVACFIERWEQITSVEHLDRPESGEEGGGLAFIRAGLTDSLRGSMVP
jgi:hypothetical protein